MDVDWIAAGRIDVEPDRRPPFANRPGDAKNERTRSQGVAAVILDAGRAPVNEIDRRRYDPRGRGPKPTKSLAVAVPAGRPPRGQKPRSPVNSAADDTAPRSRQTRFVARPAGRRKVKNSS